jgi:hypothetical protein
LNFDVLFIPRHLVDGRGCATRENKMSTASDDLASLSRPRLFRYRREDRHYAVPAVDNSTPIQSEVPLPLDLPPVRREAVLDLPPVRREVARSLPIYRDAHVQSGLAVTIPYNSELKQNPLRVSPELAALMSHLVSANCREYEEVQRSKSGNVVDGERIWRSITPPPPSSEDS